MIRSLLSSALILSLSTPLAHSAEQEAASLSTQEAATTLESLWKKYAEDYKSSADYKAFGELPPALPAKPDKNFKLVAKGIKTGEHTMPFVVLNKTPEEGKKSPLYICLHGGGQFGKAEGPHAWPVNTREWQTQISLAAGRYPKHGVFFVPRMADDRLGRWYHDLNVDVFDRMIKHAILEWNVDPNKVYLLGISEGGYGTDKLLPYMADRFAAGNSMAAGSLVKIGSHTTAENLRDTPMRTDIGGNDTMFNRVGLAKELHQVLDKFEQANPGHYVHKINIHEGKGHGGWDYGLGPVWLAQHSRDPQPSKLVWVTSPAQKLTRPMFYWLGLSGDNIPKVCRIEAHADKAKNIINIKADVIDKENDKLTPLTGVTLNVFLNDKLINLDQAFTVNINGTKVHEGKAPRLDKHLSETIKMTGDPTQAYPVILKFEL
ncbi:hypothetical protein SAMN02745181_1560 [Rubritalea squalenifaciens DSM 18772]|uniref:Esterase PHB depolymerase n=1 Tax=Rubritalea squalenifaciens DSM 18772 TaxID=1123071 RepID=A0A1M6HSU1_9BACT|nr:hypothetical protein [Rubritalea squalenifaciens]SHJ25286.1 hypothetical protein SAMN02745181_1560 [Rubritalea squalenifaciens DSM 18772]